MGLALLFASVCLLLVKATRRYYKLHYLWRTTLGTTPVDGSCVIQYHGTTLGDGATPPDDTSSIIQAGEQLIFLLGTGNPAVLIVPAPEFQGDIIAVCDFPLARGTAFLNDGFGSVPTLMFGTKAEVLPAVRLPKKNKAK